MTVSLIIPCYNEELNIQKGALDKIGNYTKHKKSIGEILIIDDGSTDNTNEIIKTKYLRKFSKFRLIENKHQGKAFAIISGIQNAKGDYIAFSDFDLATPMEEIEKLMKEARNGLKIIIGSRSTKRKGAPLIRKLMALGYIVIRDALLNLRGIKDTQCGFKMFEKKTVEKVLSRLVVFKKPKIIKGSSVGAGFDVEFLFVASKLGFTIKEVPVEWAHAESKRVGVLKDSIDSLRDILRIKYADILGKYGAS